MVYCANNGSVRLHSGNGLIILSAAGCCYNVDRNIAFHSSVTPCSCTFILSVLTLHQLGLWCVCSLLVGVSEQAVCVNNSANMHGQRRKRLSSAAA